MPDNLPTSEDEEFEFRLREEQEAGRGGGDESASARGDGFAEEVEAPPLPAGGPAAAADYLRRLAKGSISSLTPTSIEEVRRLLSPAVGRAGLSRVAEEEGARVADSVRGSARNIAKDIPGVPGKALEFAADITADQLRPSSMAESIGADVALGPARAWLSALRRGAGPAGKFAGRKVLSAVFGPSEEAIIVRATRGPEVREAAKTGYDTLAKNLAKATEVVDAKIRPLDTAAREALSAADDGVEAISKGDVLSKVDAVRSRLSVGGGGPIGPAQQKAATLLDSLRRGIAGLGDSVDPLMGGRPKDLSQKTVRDLIEQLDQNINWEDPGASVVNDALTGLREGLDTALKTKNPAYAERMKPVAALTRLYRNLKSKFGLRVPAGEGVQSTDVTEGVLRASSNETRGETRKLLGKLKGQTGQDFADQARLVRLAKEFERGNVQGSRRALLGTTLGTATGMLTGDPVAGAAAGAGAGVILDKEGGRIAGALIDFFSRGGKPTPQMLKAAEGNPALRQAMVRALEAVLVRGGADNAE